MSSTIAENAQYITFKLGDEFFAINVTQVREILELSQITKVPTAPHYMRGVVNVRGKAIPVADLRSKFGLPRAADTVQTRIIVMEIEIEGDVAVVGGIADSVHEVIELEANQIAPAPQIAMRWRSELIKGMARRGDEFLILLDIQTVFSLEDCGVAEPPANPVDVMKEPVAV
jgi:purine-binding chemotaxis protein CheW